MIATKYQAVEVQRRAGDAWTLHLFGPGNELQLTCIGVCIPIAKLYRGTTVPVVLNDQNEQ